MRKVATLFIALAFIACPSLGQNLNLGVRGGANSATFGSSDNSLSDDYSRRTIYNIGVFLEQKLTRQLSLRPELAYTRRGAALGEVEVRNEEGVSQGTYKDGEYEFDYLQMPILIVADLLGGRSIQPRIFAGPSMSYLLASTLEVGEPATGDISGSPGESDIESSEFNFEAVVGVGIAYEVTKNSSLLVEVRYARGFTDVLPDGDANVRNQVLSANLGFSVTL